MPEAPKSGFKTSEWWGVVLTALVAVLPVFLSAFTDAQAGGHGVAASLGVALAAAVYAYGRAKVKTQHETVKRAEVRRLRKSSDVDLAEELEDSASGPS